jgi:hypothetical protein
MPVLTHLQRRILSVLEEAGEECFTALTNTVAKPNGQTNEIQAMTNALCGLISKGLIVVSKDRDNSSLCWIPISDEESFTIFKQINGFGEWANSSRIWKLKSDLPNLIILLTSSGKELAIKILSEDGWPELPLDSYE